MQHKREHLAEDTAEFLGTCPLIAQAGEIVLHQRMGDDGDGFHAMQADNVSFLSRLRFTNRVVKQVFGSVGLRDLPEIRVRTLG